MPAESTIVSRRDAAGRLVEVRCPAHPNPCEYVRIVVTADADVDDLEDEIAYWDADEIAEDPGCEVLGAILGAIKSVADGVEIKL